MSQCLCQLLALGEVWLVSSVGKPRAPSVCPCGSQDMKPHHGGLWCPHSMDMARTFHGMFAIEGTSWEEPGEELQCRLDSSAAAWAPVIAQQPGGRLRHPFVLVMDSVTVPVCFTVTPHTRLRIWFL